MSGLTWQQIIQKLLPLDLQQRSVVDSIKDKTFTKDEAIDALQIALTSSDALMKENANKILKSVVDGYDEKVKAKTGLKYSYALEFFAKPEGLFRIAPKKTKGHLKEVFDLYEFYCGKPKLFDSDNTIEMLGHDRRNGELNLGVSRLKESEGASSSVSDDESSDIYGGVTSGDDSDSVEESERESATPFLITNAAGSFCSKKGRHNDEYSQSDFNDPKYMRTPHPRDQDHSELKSPE